jgi:flagellin-like hook-associated protein FlgL
MSVTGISSQTSVTVQSLVNLRSQLDDLQRQLVTGQKSDTYAGLGLGRGLTVGLRNQLSQLSSFDDNITSIGVRLSLGQTALTSIATAADTVKQSALSSTFSVDAAGQTGDQRTALGQLDQILSLLNTQAGDNYLFSGTATDQPAVETTDHIVNGNGTQAGLKTVIAQRNAADGVNALGRLLIPVPAAASTVASISEDVAGSVFGLKLAGVSSTLTGANVSGPAGVPPQISVDLNTNTLNAGEAVTFSFTLPDGSSQNVTLTATAAAPPGPNQFTIGADAHATAVNLQAALTSAVGQLAATSLSAASTVAAGNDFFGGPPPMRVSGPPATATALVAGTATDTVSWYTGENGPGPARNTAIARVDPSLTVAYGMRANEQALRQAVQSIAVFAAQSYSAADPNAPGAYAALTQRVASALQGAPGQQKITDIEADLASAQATATAAQDRHQQSTKTLTDLLQSVEKVPQEQVAAEILALQTSLQASLQTTALLSKISLVNYLPVA